MIKNIRLLSFMASLLILIQTYAFPSPPYPQNTSMLGDIKMDPIDNATVREKYFQFVNLVDVFHKLECTWYISDELRIGDESYFILLQDPYNLRTYYLCRKPSGEGYPEILRICEMSLAADSMQFFEIDEHEGIITITDHMYVYDEKGLPVNNADGETLFLLKKKTYRLYGNFELISDEHTYKFMDESDAIIKVWK